MDSNIGYKIKHGHFKLGSKAHVRDFIYAKRLFQNSFFAHRFAFIVARYIENQYYSKLSMRKKSLTILGYGEYSQMLVNRIERLLQPMIENINHDMINDAENPALIKGELLNENVIIIVPISTTLSTSIKVENMVNQMKVEGKCDSEILEPFINLIEISHNDLNSQTYVDGLNVYLDPKMPSEIDPKYHPYKLYNWLHVDKGRKIVKIKTNPPLQTEKNEKYFISIESEWFMRNTCKFCIPDNVLKEKPLLGSDKASVTPDLLLDLPISFIENSVYAEKDVEINKEAVYSGHFEYMGNHHLNYIRPLQFYRKNEDAIIAWAKKIKADPVALIGIHHGKTILISPSQQNNTYFVEIINRYIFDDAATILHYEINGDFIENYQKFFGDEINSSKYIFYIDDVIQTGRNFHIINDFVKLCKKLNFTSSGPDGCNGVFTLFNKTDRYSYTDILAHLNNDEIHGTQDENRFFAFCDIKINSISKENCPLCLEQKKYEDLSESSMLDTIRHYFLNKKVKLNTKKIPEIDRINPEWLKFHPLVDETKLSPWNTNDKAVLEKWEIYTSSNFPDKSHLKLLIKNELNNLISNDESIRNKFELDTSDFQNDQLIYIHTALFKEIKNKIIISTSINKIILKQNETCALILEELCGEIIIKLLTFQPLVNVKVIKEKIFTWILIELERIIDVLITKDKLIFKDFRYFKFLLRRATILGSNYLIRQETLSNLRLIYAKYTEEKRKLVEDERSRKLNHFKNELTIVGKQILECDAEIFTLDQNLATFDDLYDAEDPLKIQQIQLIKTNRDRKISFEKQKSILDHKLNYLKQAINNIYYKEAALSEFSYFYVALIKELTFNNDEKVLTLEENLKAIKALDSKDSEPDFFFLVRLINFENTSIINQGLKIIANEYLLNLKENPEDSLNLIRFDRKCNEQLLLDKIKEHTEKAFEDYRLSTFKEFLGIDNFSDWSKTQEFIIYQHLLYLITSFKNEELHPSALQLEDKTKGIIQNIFRIVAYPDFSSDVEDIDPKTDRIIRSYFHDDINSGAFISVRYKENLDERTNPQEIVISQATSEHISHSGVSLMKAEIDNESLSYFIMNGLSNRNSAISNELMTPNETNLYDEYPLKPWTILEIQLKRTANDKYWHSLRGKIFPINSYFTQAFEKISRGQENGELKYGFNENLYVKGEPKSFMFFRIADIFETEGKIKNIGKSVVGIFNSDEQFDINRVRLLLLVGPYFLKFIKTHFDSDSLTAFIQEKIKLKEAEKLQHGYLSYLNGLYMLANSQESSIDQEEREDFSKLYLGLVKSGPLLYSIFTEIEYFKSKKQIIREDYWVSKGLPLKQLSPQMIVEKFEKMAKMILSTSNINTIRTIDLENNFKITVVNSEMPQKIINFPEALIDTIFAELLINAKKNFPNDFAELYFEMPANNDESFQITISNNYEIELSEKALLRIQKNNVKYNTNGLGLIKRITGLLSEQYATVNQGYVPKYKKKLFQVSLILKTPKNV